MPRRTEEWDKWFKDLGVPPGLKTRRVECVYCMKKFQYRADRMLSHLGYRDGQNPADVGLCPKVPPHIRALFASCGGIVPNPFQLIDEVNNQEHRMGEVTLPQTQHVMADGLDVANENPPMLSSQNSTEVGRNPPIAHVRENFAGRGLRQLSMQEGLHSSAKLSLDRIWSTAFYEANIPFNVVRHPSFVNAVKQTAAMKLTYKPPSYHAMRTSLLKARRAQVEVEVNDRTKDSIRKYGVTVCSDGWDNVQNRPLLNVLLCCPTGDTFLGSIDTTGNKKDAAYIAEQMSIHINRVGPSNVVQVCTDNASSMVAAGRILTQRHPHLYFQGCGAHILDLLLQDWGSEAWVRSLVKKARKICVFVRGHHATQALFRHYSPNHILRMPADTRFATNFIMVDRLVQVRAALERMIIDDRWGAFMIELRGRGGNGHEVMANVRRSIRQDGFWDSCENFLFMVTPVLEVLRVFDGKQPSMGKAWLVMHNLQSHVQKFPNPPFNLDGDIAERALDQFQSRWSLMLTDLHWAGALLNPFLIGNMSLHENPRARPALNRVLRKLTHDEASYLLGITEFQDFIENRGAFEGVPAAARADLPPHEWWDAFGHGAFVLSGIAKRILAQVCSASSCERNWSMYSFVHNKVRNRLTPSRAEDLVFIYTNTRLMRRRRGSTTAQWYARNMYSDDESENEDFEDDPDFNPEDGDDDNGFNPDDNDVADDPYGDRYGGQGFDVNESDASRHSSTESEESDGGYDDDGLDGMNVYDFNEGNEDNRDASVPFVARSNADMTFVPLQRANEVHPPIVPCGEGCSTDMANNQPLEDITHVERPIQQPCHELSTENETPSIVIAPSPHMSGVGATLLSLSQSRDNIQTRTTGAPTRRPLTRLRVRAENSQSSIPFNTPDLPTTELVGGSNTRGRGLKRLSRRMPRSFVGLHDDTRPRLDANGIRDASGSRPTKKIITSNPRTLRLRTVSPGPDDDVSSDDSGPSRAEAPDDDDFQG